MNEPTPAEAPRSPRLRGRTALWLKRLILALLALTGLYLVGVNLLINTSLSSLLNRRPERFKISWSRAWSIWPGLVHVRGLAIEGHSRNVEWTVAAERAQGWIGLPQLLGRRFHLRSLHAEEVRSSVVRGRGVGAPPRPPPPPGKRRTPWTLTFDGIFLEHVREMSYNAFRLTGDGRASGSFSSMIGREFRLDDTRLTMPAGRLDMGRETIGRELNLQTELSIAPFSPRQHRGMAAYDFLSGTLKARGRAEIPFLERSVSGPGVGKPGSLVADLRVERGRLLTGSKAELVAPHPPGSASPFVLTASVDGGAAGPQLRLGLDSRGLQAGRRQGAPPVFQSAALTGSLATPEVRLRRIFTTTRELRKSRQQPGLVSTPLMADLRAEGVKFDAPGSRARLRAVMDRAAGRLDFAGLVQRKLDMEGLQAEGVAIRLDLVKGPTPSPAGPGTPWAVHMSGARLAGIREVALDEFLLAGETRAEATFTYGRDGTLAVERAALEMPSGRLDAGGETAARDLSLDLDARIEPLVLGGAAGLTFLRQISATADIRSRISSLGFLRPYLAKTPWLGLQGQGLLDAKVRLEAGRLMPGTRLSLTGAEVRADIFDSRASGRGTVRVAVEPVGTGARTSLLVRLDRFGFNDPRQPGSPAYLRGRALRISAASPSALDLAAPSPDFGTTLDLPDAEVPDLAVYNALLPDGAGLAILGGKGQARLHLETSTVGSKAKGNLTLTSDDARVVFQGVEVEGGLSLQAPIASQDLLKRRFDLDGTRLDLARLSYREVGEEAPVGSGWWAQARLTDGSLVWGQPLSLRGEGRVVMRDTGPLLALFAQRRRFLKWFDEILTIEEITARGKIRIEEGVVAIEAFQATGGKLEIRSRMLFSKTRQRGDLLILYGRLSAGIEMRDGKRDFKLIRAREWFENGRSGWR